MNLSAGLANLGARFLALASPRWAQRLAIRSYRWSGSDALRYAAPVPMDGLVLDLGGFEGDFAAAMRRQHRCRVWVFEPVPGFAKRLRKRFEKDAKVRVFGFGLAGKAARPTLVLDGPSTRQGSGKGVKVSLKAAAPFFKAQGFRGADLAKINIEGGEFELLESLVRGPWIGRLRRLQIQFHPHVERAAARRGALHASLSRTHRLEWDHPWIWESWVLKTERTKEI